MKVKVAATQMSITWDIENNIKKAKDMVREAAHAGAKVILLKNYLKHLISVK